MDFKYEICFILHSDVKSINDAQECLNTFDTARYIKENIDINIFNKIINIEYKLRSPYYGDIYIITNQLLEKNERDKLKNCLSNFLINEINIIWKKQNFASVDGHISEFKPLAEYKDFDLKEN